MSYIKIASKIKNNSKNNRFMEKLNFIKKIWRALEGVECWFRYCVLGKKRFIDCEVCFENEPKIIQWLNRKFRSDAHAGKLPEEQILRMLKKHPADINNLPVQSVYLREYPQLMGYLGLRDLIVHAEISNFKETLYRAIENQSGEFLNLMLSSEKYGIEKKPYGKIAAKSLSYLSNEQLKNVNTLLNRNIKFPWIKGVPHFCDEAASFIISKMNGELCFLAVVSRLDIAANLCMNNTEILEKVQDLLIKHFSGWCFFERFNRNVVDLLNLLEKNNKCEGIIRALIFAKALDISHLRQLLINTPNDSHEVMVRFVKGVLSGDYKDYLDVKSGGNITKGKLCKEAVKLLNADQAIQYVAKGGHLQDSEIIALIERGFPIARIEAILGENREISQNLREIIIRKKLLTNSLKAVDGLQPEMFELIQSLS